MAAHDCDAVPELDGALYFRRVSLLYVDGSTDQRALHVSPFVWTSPLGRIEGMARGFANLGTHRAPLPDPAQHCEARGMLEGQLEGHVVETRNPKYVGATIVADYRLRWDFGARRSALVGVIEGVVGVPCEQTRCVLDECVDFSAMPDGSDANPRVVSGASLRVRAPDGSVAASTDIRTWSGFTGLNVGSRVIITFREPVRCVAAELVHFNTAPTLTARGEDGGVLGSDTHIGGDGVVDTVEVHASGISSVEIVAPASEVLLLKLCWGR